MKKIIKRAGAMLLICAGTLLFSVQLKAQSQDNKKATPMKSVNEKVAILYLKVDGMHCQRFCANGTDSLLKHTPGVLFSKTTFAISSSVVKYDPSLITPKKIIQVIDKRGFKAKIKKEE